ncbi:hypothetical protein J0H58_08580 [bacterium]|nr:hypothetical protein [bacterium]
MKAAVNVVVRVVTCLVVLDAGPPPFRVAIAAVKAVMCLVVFAVGYDLLVVVAGAFRGPVDMSTNVKQVNFWPELPDFQRARVEWLRKAARVHPRPRAALHLQVGPERVTARLELEIYKSHPLVHEQTPDGLRFQLAALVRASFGHVQLDSLPLFGDEVTAATWEVLPNADTVRLVLSTSRWTSGIPYISIFPSHPSEDAALGAAEVAAEVGLLATPLTPLLPGRLALAAALRGPPAEVHATLNRVQIEYCSPFPMVATAERVTVHFIPRSDYVNLLFTAVRSPSETVPPAYHGERLSRGEYFRRLGERPADAIPQRFRVFWWALGAILPVLPLALAWYTLRAEQPQGVYTALISKLLGVVIGFHVFASTGRFLPDFFLFIDPNNRAGEYVRAVWSQLPIGRAFPFRFGGYGLAPILSGVLMPALLVAVARDSKPSLQARWRWWAAAIVAGALPAAVVGRTLDTGGPFGRVVGAVVVILIVVLWATFAILVRVLGLPWSGRLATVAVLLTGVLAVAESDRYEFSGWGGQVTTDVANLLASAVLLTAVVYLVWSAIRSVRGRAKVRGWVWLAVFAAATATAIPAPVFFQIDGRVSTVSFARQLDAVLRTLWFAGPLWLLAARGQVGLLVDAWTRRVGLVVAAALFFGTAAWLVVPIPFLLGLGLLAWYVRGEEYWKKLEPLVQKVQTDRPKLLAEILRLNLAEVATRMRRRKFHEKVAAGESTVIAAEKELADGQQELDKLREQSRVGGRDAREVAFILGPFPTAWANGVHGAWWSAVLALPWVVLYFVKYLSEPIAVNTPYPLWDLFAEPTALLAKWAGFGFVFGYFFPYLRGQSGLAKGLYYCPVLLLPSLVLLALGGSAAATTVLTVTPAAEAAGSLFLALQLFAHCVLLGLFAFDYAALRVGQRDWRMLFDIHGLPSLGVTASTVVAAVVAAVTTVVQTNAVALVTTASTFVVPTPPAAPAPHSGMSKAQN